MSTRAGWLYPLLIFLILAGAVALRVADPFFVQALRLIVFDSYQRLSPEAYDPALPVRIVDLDEESLERVGQWPWPRTVMAELLNRLAEQGAAVVAIDALFAEPDQTSREQIALKLSEMGGASVDADTAVATSNDEVLGTVIGDTTVVLSTALGARPGPPPPPKAGFAFAGDDPRPFVPEFAGASRNLPVLDAAAAGIGSINWIPDRDQVIRRIQLLFRIGDDFIPGLAPEALRVAQGATTYVLKASNASGETAFGERTGLNHIRIGQFDVPTDADGGIWLKFRPANAAAYLPAWRVLAGEDFTDEVQGRIIFIGTSAPGLIDLRATPLNASIAGVEVHAQAAEHILSGRSITRPDYAMALELAVILVFGLALAVTLLRISASQSALLGLSVLTAVIVAGWVAYSRLGLLFDPSFPAASLFALVSAASLYIFRRVEMQRAEVRRAFIHYVSPAVVDELIGNPEKLELGGVVRDLSLMFCDVRNFTAISEQMSAAELTRFINSLLTPLSEIILGNRGTIDKYMGDAIMAFWNAPLDDPDHAANACRSAKMMVERVVELNHQWRAEAEAAGRPFVPVAIGIGINTGEALVGNLGSDMRFDYSALGDEVNVASRLEGLTKVYGLSSVIGEQTVRRQTGQAMFEVDLIRVKGRSQPTGIYTLAETLGLDKQALERLEPLQAAMLDAFRRQDWDQAEALVADCLQIAGEPLATYYQIYAERIEEFRAEPPPADWDGAVTAESK